MAEICVCVSAYVKHTCECVYYNDLQEVRMHVCVSVMLGNVFEPADIASLTTVFRTSTSNTCMLHVCV